MLNAAAGNLADPESTRGINVTSSIISAMGHNLARSSMQRYFGYWTIEIGLFSEKFHVSPLSISEHCFDVVTLGRALHPQMLHLTQVKMSTW